MQHWLCDKNQKVKSTILTEITVRIPFITYKKEMISVDVCKTKPDIGYAFSLKTYKKEMISVDVCKTKPDIGYVFSFLFFDTRNKNLSGIKKSAKVVFIIFARETIFIIFLPRMTRYLC